MENKLKELENLSTKLIVYTKKEGPLTLLLIDDNTDLRDSLNDVFTMEGYKVLECDNGKDTLELLKTIEPDIAIVDLRMPRMNGIEVIKHMKVINPHIKSIILTAYPSLSSAIDAVNLGVNGYVQKSEGTEALVSLVKDLND